MESVGFAVIHHSYGEVAGGDGHVNHLAVKLFGADPEKLQSVVPKMVYWLKQLQGTVDAAAVEAGVRFQPTIWFPVNVKNHRLVNLLVAEGFERAGTSHDRHRAAGMAIDDLSTRENLQYLEYSIPDALENNGAESPITSR